MTAWGDAFQGHVSGSLDRPIVVLLEQDGTLDRIHHALYLKCREKAVREASPTACIIDSQSVKSAEKGGLASTATASMPAS